MGSLSERHRPQSYGDIVGQKEALDILLPYVRRGELRHFLFTGDTGVGKTSVALITARAFRCSGDPGGIRPCLSCTNCEDIGQGPQSGFEDYSAPNLSNSMLDDLLSTSGFLGLTGTRIVFIDEAHALKPSAIDKLLTILEKVQSTLFIFATDRPEELAPRLTNRLQVIRLRPLELDVSIDLLGRICRREGFDFDDEALALIAEISSGSARALLANLEDVSSSGERITTELARRRLNLDQLRAYVAPLAALINGDHKASFDYLNRITATPREKSEALKSLVIQLYENAILGLIRPGLEIAGIDRDQRKRIAESIGDIATKKNVPVDDVIEHLTTHLSPSGSKINDAWLKTNLLHLKTFLHPAISAAPRPSKNRMPGRVLKKSRSLASTPAHLYLSKSKIAEILDAASCFAQATGRLFNFRLVFLHERMQLDQVQGRQLVSSCLHQLSMRIKAWSGNEENLQYIYLHQVSAKVGFNTTVAGWMPIDAAYDVANWIDEFLARSCNSTSAGRGVKLTFHRISDERGELQQHWRFLKSLCRTLDPTLEVESERRRRPIADLLRISKRIREPIGPLLPCHPVRMSISATPYANGTPMFPMLSAFRDGAWRELQTGWELREYEDRSRELKKHQAAVRRLSEQFDHNHDLRDSEIRALARRYPTNPYDRDRTWRVWRRRKEMVKS